MSVTEKQAHTPGPWELSPLNDLGPVEVYTRDHRRIAMVVVSGISASDEINANARLIAAAPDLLDALKALRDPAFGNPSYPADTARVEALADAAIAKAEGQP